MVGFFKEQFEDLIKNDQKNLRDLTKEIERHCKERLELRRTLNITGNSLLIFAILAWTFPYLPNIFNHKKNRWLKFLH